MILTYEKPYNYFTQAINRLRKRDGNLQKEVIETSKDPIPTLTSEYNNQRVNLTQKQKNKFYIAKLIKGFRILESQIDDLDLPDEDYENYLLKVKLAQGTRKSNLMQFIQSNYKNLNQ
jgi:hypothetical protein